MVKATPKDLTSTRSYDYVDFNCGLKIPLYCGISIFFNSTLIKEKIRIPYSQFRDALMIAIYSGYADSYIIEYFNSMQLREDDTEILCKTIKDADDGMISLHNIILNDRYSYTSIIKYIADSIKKISDLESLGIETPDTINKDVTIYIDIAFDRHNSADYKNDNGIKNAIASRIIKNNNVKEAIASTIDLIYSTHTISESHS